jgi:hypothetical protein
MLSNGMSAQEIQDDFPELTADDIRAVLTYAAHREHQVVSLQVLRPTLIWTNEPTLTQVEFGDLTHIHLGCANSA